MRLGLRITLTIIGSAAAALLAACGGGGSTSPSTSTSNGGSQTATVKVGALPIAADAPIFVGVSQGIFARHHLKVVPQIARGGSAIIAGVVSGSFQFGFADTVSTLLAANKGLPLRVVAMGSEGGSKPANDYSCLDVGKRSPIRSPKDLEGSTIAVNLLKNIVNLAPKAALAKRGVDVDKLEFTEISIPDEPAALAQGRVDAVSVTEPFCSLMKSKGAHVIVVPFADAAPNLLIADWVTTQSYIDQHPDVAKRFADAMAEADAYSQAHPDAVRKAVEANTEIPPEAARAMTLPRWSARLDRDSLRLIDKLSRRFRLYGQPVDVNGLVPSFVAG